MPYVIYFIYQGEQADKSSKIPIDIALKELDIGGIKLVCEAKTFEELEMFFNDYYRGGLDLYYLRTVSGVNSENKKTLEEILTKPERRRQMHIGRQENFDRRTRTYKTHLPPPF